jgi:dTDP-4-dehydrorhamnose reductase
VKKNILITGITGMLGQAIYLYFKEMNVYNIYGVTRQTNYELPGTKLFYGDLSSEFLFSSIKEHNFYAVIHCSAEINVNLCETNKKIAYDSNFCATKNILKFLTINKFIYISTDSVFDGKKGNYSESDQTNPLNYYAETKLMAEDIIKKSTNNFYILRTNIYGFNTPLKKSLFEWAYKELHDEKNISGYINMFFNPMYVGNLAEVVAQLLTNDTEFGTYNITSNDKISKYDFLIKIAKFFDFDSLLVIPTEFQNNESVAPRAMDTTLCNKKIKSVLTNVDYSIDNGLKRLNNDLISNYEKIH